MRRISICFLGVTLLAIAAVLRSPAQEKPAEQPKLWVEIPPAPPTSGFRAEFLDELSYYEQRYTGLADAMPAEKYSWRPGEGVRSVGEVFAHIAVANVLVGRALGGPLKPGVSHGIDNEAVAKNTMALAGDKAKLLQTLKSSFSLLRNDVLHLSDADADKPQKMFNRQTTLRGALMMIDRHWGEHLGQSIAYARVNGVVPPWTQEFQQQQQKPADKPKP